MWQHGPRLMPTSPMGILWAYMELTNMKTTIPMNTKEANIKELAFNETMKALSKQCRASLKVSEVVQTITKRALLSTSLAEISKAAQMTNINKEYCFNGNLSVDVTRVPDIYLKACGSCMRVFAFGDGSKIAVPKEINPHLSLEAKQEVTRHITELALAPQKKAKGTVKTNAAKKEEAVK